MDTLRSVTLYCQYGTSDKVYHIALIRQNIRPTMYQVIAQYGKRTDQHLKTEIKISSSSQAIAAKKFEALMKDKMNNSNPRSRYYLKNGIPTGKQEVTALKNNSIPLSSTIAVAPIPEPTPETQEYINLNL